MEMLHVEALEQGPAQGKGSIPAQRHYGVGQSDWSACADAGSVTFWRRCPNSHSVRPLWPEPQSEALQPLSLGGAAPELLKVVAAWNIKERFLGKNTNCSWT